MNKWKQKKKLTGNCVKDQIPVPALSAKTMDPQVLILKNEEFYRILVSLLPGAVIVIDMELNVRMFNLKAKELFGFGEDEDILGENAQRYISPTDIKRIKEDFRKIKKFVNKDYKFIRKNGTVFQGDLSASVMNDSESNLRYFVCIVNDVTERKLFEEKITNCAMEWRVTFDSMDDFITIQDKNGKIIRANYACKKIFEMELEDLVGKKSYDLYKGINGYNVDCLHKKVVRSGLSMSNEEIEIKKNVWIEQLCSPVFDLKRNIIGTVILGKDITLRKKTEDDLRLFSEAVNMASDGIQITNLNGEIVYSNLAIKNIYGYEPEELIGKHVSSLNADPEFVAKVILPTIFKEGRWCGELMIKQKSGKQLPVLLTTSIVNDKNGVPVAMMGIIKDISEQKKSETIKEAASKEWRDTFDSISDSIAILDTESRIVRVNRSFSESMNLQPQEVIGKPCWEVFHNTNERPKECMYDEVLKNRSCSSRELYNPITGLYYEDTLSPVYDECNEFSGVVHISKDITERKKSEEIIKRDKDIFENLVNERTAELVDAQRELEQAKRLSDIGALAATVAHELRNPLSVIRAAVYNVRRKTQGIAIGNHLLNIEKKISESDQIINNLLFYSRIKEPNYEKVRVCSVLDECLSFAKERYEKWDVIIEGECERIVNTFIEADVLQLNELFNNIINNAYESFAERKGKIRIMGGLNGENQLWITIIDNGSGVDPKDMKKLLEPFFTNKSKGTGLGLTVCRKIVKHHDGEIFIDSEKGKGTAVTILLPVRRKNNEKTDTDS